MTSDAQKVGYLSDFLPQFYPSVPSLEERVVDTTLVNPFAEGSINRYSAYKRKAFLMPENGFINGYIKFSFRPAENTFEPSQKNVDYQNSSLGIHHRDIPVLPSGENILPLPKHFGHNMKLDPTDRKLLRFCELHHISVTLDDLLVTNASAQILAHFAPAAR